MDSWTCGNSTALDDVDLDQIILPLYILATLVYSDTKYNKKKKSATYCEIIQIVVFCQVLNLIQDWSNKCAHGRREQFESVRLILIVFYLQWFILSRKLQSLAIIGVNIKFFWGNHGPLYQIISISLLRFLISFI